MEEKCRGAVRELRRQSGTTPSHRQEEEAMTTTIQKANNNMGCGYSIYNI
jgi:hypothetical protein